MDRGAGGLLVESFITRLSTSSPGGPGGSSRLGWQGSPENKLRTCVGAPSWRGKQISPVRAIGICGTSTRPLRRRHRPRPTSTHPTPTTGTGRSSRRGGAGSAPAQPQQPSTPSSPSSTTTVSTITKAAAPSAAVTQAAPGPGDQAAAPSAAAPSRA